MKTALLLLSLIIAGCRVPEPAPRRVRSRTAVAHFKKQQPCPANGNTKGPCPGYVVDHIVPFACGGPDDPSNMQWQTTEEAKAKDKWELKVYCK